jgi:hypothetical protein
MTYFMRQSFTSTQVAAEYLKSVTPGKLTYSFEEANLLVPPRHNKKDKELISRAIKRQKTI